VKPLYLLLKEGFASVGESSDHNTPVVLRNQILFSHQIFFVLGESIIKYGYAGQLNALFRRVPLNSFNVNMRLATHAGLK